MIRKRGAGKKEERKKEQQQIGSIDLDKFYTQKTVTIPVM